MNKPWNMARARALAYRTPRKHKPLVVGPDEATVAHVRNRDHAALRRLRARDIKGVDFGLLGIDEADVQPTRSGTGAALVHKLAQDMREAPDRATSMPADTPDDKAYWLIDRIEMWLRSDHAVEYDAEHNSIMLRNEPDKGNVWAMPVEDFDGLTDEQLNRYLDKCCQSLREINRDTLPPGWERLEPEKGELEAYHHPATGAQAWRLASGEWLCNAPGNIGGSAGSTRAEAMAAALALVPVGAEREGWYEENPGVLRYMEPRNAGVAKVHHDRWAGGGVYYDTQLEAQIAVEAAHRELGR